MSKKCRIAWPVRAISALLSVLLALALAAGCAGYMAVSVLTHDSLHEQVALDSRVTDMQMARITSRVEELAAQYSFSPESVLDVVTRDSVAAYSREVIAWWMGLLGENPRLEAPGYPTDDVEAAVRADELFRASVPAFQQRTVARDSVAYEVGRTVKGSVLPLRTELMALAMPTLMERVNLPLWAGRLERLPLLCAAAALGLAVLVLVLMHARPDKAALYIGTALAGAALTVLGVTALAPLLDLVGMAAELSDILALQLKVLWGILARRAVMMALPALVCGYGLILVHQRHGRKRA